MGCECTCQYFLHQVFSAYSTFRFISQRVRDWLTSLVAVMTDINMWCLEAIKLVYQSFESTCLPQADPILPCEWSVRSYPITKPIFSWHFEKCEMVIWNLNPLGRVYGFHKVNHFMVNIARHSWKWGTLKCKKGLILQPHPNALSMITSLTFRNLAFHI